MTLCLLIASALLESGGDALVRAGLHGRWLLLPAGAASLVAYGILVNQSRLDFGRLMGAYIVAFYVISQLIAWLWFHQAPGPRTIFGGGLLLAGGAVILY